MMKKNLFPKVSLSIITLIMSLMAANLSIAGDTIKTELITLGIKAQIGPYYYLDKNEVKELSISRHGISSPVIYRGSIGLLLYLNKPTAEDIKNLKSKKDPAPKPDLVVKLDKTTGRTLLLFSQRKTKENEPSSTLVRSHPISNTSSSNGDYLIFNLSKLDVYILLDKKIKQIKPQKSVTFKAATWKESAVDLEIKLGQKKDDQLKSVYNSVWGHQPNQRAILFVYDRGGKKGGLAIRRYYDHPGNSQASR
jgi:hypothetical protein